MSRKQHGFTSLVILLMLVLLVFIGFAGWKVMSKTKTGESNTSAEVNKTKEEKTEEAEEEPQKLIWQQTATGWRATETAPSCPSQPMLVMPSDVSKITSVLYPGQTRGGNYKPHGGFRFDNATDNTVTVTAPMSGYIIRGSRYLAEGSNEIQYTFDIMNNCGVMHRLGHLRALPEKLQKIVEAFPEATTSSATQNVNPAVYVKKGDVLATKVGITKEKNTFYDWGVFDYRQENEISRTTAYQSAHPQPELTWHAVCWLKDWLPSDDTAALAKLPAGDPTSGKNSDYCK